MVLGKRSRNSLSSSASSSSSATSSYSKSTKATSSSSPASSARSSPAPSLKRARTRSSDSLIDDPCNKENKAPPNWFVCGRPADSEHGDDENMETDDDEESPSQNLTVPSRELRARSRPSGSRVSVVIPLRLGRSRSAQVARASPSSPPQTPRTPSVRLSKLSIVADDEKSSTDANEQDSAMKIDVPTPVKSPKGVDPPSIYGRARALLRATNTSSLSETLTSSTTVIAARNEERATIQNFILGGDFLSNASESDEDCNSSLYISGSPGTGKTALVTDILRQLALSAAKGSITPASLYVNCMGLPDVRSVWSRVWEELVQTLGGSPGSKLKSGDAKKYLEDALKRDDGLRCILVLDELDFISRTPAALSEIYQLAQKYPSTIRLIGISNTLTLGSNASSPSDGPTTPSKSARSLSKSSLVGPQISLNFSAYSSPDLLVILKARLAPLEAEQDRIVNPTALTFLSKKVAASNGDVRYAMSVLRRCIDSAEKESMDASSNNSNKGRVDMKHVLESLRAHESGSALSGGSGANASNSKGSGVSRTVRGLGLHARLVLVALLMGWKRINSTLPLMGKMSDSKGVSDSMTSTTLYAFYVHLLSSTTSTTAFQPVSRNEFQDIVGVLETSGLISFSSSLPNLQSSASPSALPVNFSASNNPKTPSKPRASKFARSSSLNVLATPSRSGKGRPSASSSESYVVLSESAREDDIHRGLVQATVGAEVGSGGVVEREVESLWTREVNRVVKDIERRDRKVTEEMEKRRLEKENGGEPLGFED